VKCEEVVRAVLGEPVKREGAELIYRCPYPEQHSNGDAHPSLKINTQKNAWGCFVCGSTGRSAWTLAAFLAGLDPKDKRAVTQWLKQRGLISGRASRRATSGRGPIVAEFIHYDENGDPVCKKRRHEPGANGKEKDYSWQRFENGKWLDGLGIPPIIPPLYRLPRIQNEPLVFLFESHTDVDRAVKMCLPATTSGGSNSWREEYADLLAGKDVCIVPDNNGPGAKYAATVSASLAGKARSLRIISITPHPDFRRWADAGGTLEQILDLYHSAPEFRPANGAELIRRLEEIFNRYIVAAKGVALVCAVYAFMTYCFEIFSWIGYLAFCSPLESCGKSQASDIVGWASARPEIVVSITEAALFRLITKDKPTVVIDEAEVLSGDGETAVALRAVLHAGCAPDDTIIRCAPNTHELQRFSPWCPKIFCYIGKLPRVLSSRCIEIAMKRKGAGERVRPFIRHRVKAEASKLGAEIELWVVAHQAEIRRVYETLPDDSFGDRVRQNSAPLEAVLSVADPDRLREFQQVRSTLTTASDASLSDDAVQVRLLLDIKKVFEDKHTEELPSKELVEKLAAIETSPWGEWSKGKPLSQAKLARLLKPFQIYPGQSQNGQMRGYRLSDFQDAFARYLPPESVKVSETRENSGSDANLKVSDENTSDASKNAVLSSTHAPSRHFDILKARIEGSKAEKQPILEWEA
jgi:Protein of unknown function (DUF3631)